MKTIIKATLGATLAASVALAGTITGPATASGTTDARAATSLTDYGYRGDVYGVKLVTDSVEQTNLKDAHAQQRCTRTAGAVVDKQSVITVPDNPLINVSLSTSRTQTYKSGTTYGIRGTNTIGDVSIGGTAGPLTTPKLVIKGLRTTADAFRTPRGYGHTESFTFASIRFEFLENTIVENLPPELQQLLAPLKEVTDTVFQGTDEIAKQVFTVLQQATEPIQIPGLGTIALGYKNGKTSKHNARSQASALRIHITAGDRNQRLELGTSRVVMGGPAPAGVFRASGNALNYQALQDQLRFGNVERMALPCEGTRGVTQTKKVANASQLLPVPVMISNVTYQVNGKQVRRKKLAKGWVSTSIGQVSIPAAQLEINNLVTKVTMRGKLKRRVRASVTTSIGSILVDGQPVAIPAPGSSVALPNGTGVIERQVVSGSRRGRQAIGLRVKLFEEAVVVDLAQSDGRIYPR